MKMIFSILLLVMTVQALPSIAVLDLESQSVSTEEISTISDIIRSVSSANN